MKYSDDFKKQVLEFFSPCFNERFKVKKHLDRCTQIVGRFLDDNRGFRISPDDYLETIANPNSEKAAAVKKEALKAKRAAELYQMWAKEEKRFDRPKI